jgi:hypothetical protein
MDDPSTKAELLAAIRASRREWDDLIGRVPPDRWSEPGAAGSWSVADTVAHVTEYDRWLALGLALRLEAPPAIWLEDLSLDDFNARLRRQFPARDPAALQADSIRVYRELIDEVEGRCEEFLFAEHHVEGVSYGVVPARLLRSESYGHYADHIPAMRAWLALPRGQPD